MRYELSPNYVPLSPFASKSGGDVPQLLWERRPCRDFIVDMQVHLHNKSSSYIKVIGSRSRSREQKGQTGVTRNLVFKSFLEHV